MIDRRKRSRTEKLGKFVFPCDGERRFRLLVEQIPIGYQSLDMDGYIIDVNQEWLNDLGYSREEVIGRWFGDFLVPEYLDTFKKNLAFFKVSGELHDVEVHMVKKDGSRIIAIFNGKMGYDEKGNPKQTHSFMNNITERKRMEKLLKESEEKYHALVEGASDAIILVDCGGNIVDANKKMEELSGYSKAELLNLHVSSIHPKEGFEAAAEIFRSIAAKGSGIFNDGVILTKDGSRIPVDVTASMIKFADQAVIQGIIRDITDRKKSEDALKEAEEKYRNIFENAMVGIFQSTPEGRFLSINPAMARIHGYNSPEKMMKEVTDITRQLYTKPERRAEWMRLVDEQNNVRGFEMPFFRKNKEKIWLSMNVRAVRNREGKVLYYEGIIEDITERKRAERQLRKSEEKLKALAAKLAETEEIEKQRLARELHDKLGQNLTAIGINLNIIKSKLPDKVKELVDCQIVDSIMLVDQTAEFVRDLMAELRTPVLDDYGLVAALLWYGQQYTTRTGIQVIIQGREPEPRLEGRVEQAMFRVVQEALTNIVKHANATTVTIKVKEKNGVVRLDVKDDGIGFKQGELSTPDRKKTSSGWGLTIMSERMEAIGGHLRVESTRCKGTKVIMEVTR